MTKGRATGRFAWPKIACGRVHIDPLDTEGERGRSAVDTVGERGRSAVDTEGERGRSACDQTQSERGDGQLTV